MANFQIEKSTTDQTVSKCKPVIKRIRDNKQTVPFVVLTQNSMEVCMYHLAYRQAGLLIESNQQWRQKCQERHSWVRQDVVFQFSNIQREE